MNFKSSFKVFIILLSCFEYGHSQSGRLTEEENQHRLNTCGKGFTAYPPPWWVLINGTDGNKIPGVYISPRHILTSSELFVTNQLEWKSENAPLQSYRVNDIMHIEVPHGMLKSYRMKISEFSPTTRQVISAHLLNIFHPKIEPSQYSPLVMEIDYNYQNISVPCLNNEFPNDRVLVEEWAYVRKDNLRREINVKSETEMLALADDYARNGEEGGVVINKTENGNVTLMGIRTMHSIPESLAQNYFYRIDWLQDDLCELVGICGPSTVTTSEPSIPTTYEITEQSSSELPTTVPTSSTTSSSIPTTKPTTATFINSEPTTPESAESTPSFYEEDEEEIPYDSVYFDPNFKDIENPRKRKKGCGRIDLFFGIFLVLWVQ